MAHRFTCSRYQRLATLQAPENATRNGIDFLEVTQKPDASGAFLTIQFVRALGVAALTAQQIRIEGGVRFGPPTVSNVTVDLAHLQIKIETVGATDFSAYVFRLVKSSGLEIPPDGFDPELSEVEFDFKAECPTDFDCLAPPNQEPVDSSAVSIDYLTKDYNSFRQLMLDRLSVTIPEWSERNPADLGVAIVETLAYAADYLSYYQDAVGTEAYLETARLRTSVRRHSRLLDYPMHDGCNARAWVFFEVQGNLVKVPKGTPLLVRRDADVVLPPNAVENPQGPVFETMGDAALWPDLNEIQLHTFFDTGCVLAKGATKATLWDQTGALSDLDAKSKPLRLKEGDLLLFEEVCNDLGSDDDADPGKRHIVRLTSVKPSEESILGPGEAGLRRIVDIEWHSEDALPFDFEVEAETPTGPVPRTVARGNIVLCDHGRTILEEGAATIEGDGRIKLTYGPVSLQGRSRSKRGKLIRDLDNKPVAFDPKGPAMSATMWSFADVYPCVKLLEPDNDEWLPQRDLLGSDSLAKEFVLEVEDDGDTFIRFGDGVLGKRPETDLTAEYRVGNGLIGNLGAGALAHICLETKSIARVRNPLPAFGGVDPEAVRDVKLHAPYAFRRLERAVTDEDYAELALRHPEVQRAVAFRQWTGSWMTVVLLVDRKGGDPIDAEFEDDMLSFFEPFRMAGYDLEINAPILVPLDIALTVCLRPDALRAHVKLALTKEFGTVSEGFFNPDNLTFGKPVYVSEIISRAMQVPGVAWVDLDDAAPKPNRFKRFGRPPAGEYLAGKIAIGPREIAQLENSPNQPENGRFELLMRGGR